mmetsp:Transcript_21952/g.51350  ORF Transcript_21952/g.51350 Transcript_21952/m.51350 type:complete len:237 (+) Transcript_21952:1027-1737(+)
MHTKEEGHGPEAARSSRQASEVRSWRRRGGTRLRHRACSVEQRHAIAHNDCKGAALCQLREQREAGHPSDWQHHGGCHQHHRGLRHCRQHGVDGCGDEDEVRTGDAQGAHQREEKHHLGTTVAESSPCHIYIRDRPSALRLLHMLFQLRQLTYRPPPKQGAKGDGKEASQHAQASECPRHCKASSAHDRLHHVEDGGKVIFQRRCALRILHVCLPGGAVDMSGSQLLAVVGLPRRA